jgi:PD-(D/E)XK nuclease superfamily
MLRRLEALRVPLRLPVPTQLPPLPSGERLNHLSASSIAELHRCPEQFRRHRLLGEPRRTTGALHLGACLDRAIAAYWRTRLPTAASMPLSLEETSDRYRHEWKRRLDEEGEIDWGDDDPATLLDRGVAALKIYLGDGGLGTMVEPQAVQRRLEHRLAPFLEWTLIAYLDLETLDGRVIDLKAKRAFVSDKAAARDLQASCYLALREAEGRPAAGFAFHTLRVGSGEIAVKETLASRSPAELQGFWVRVAQAARTLVALFEEFGPEEPWPFAATDHWACDYCALHERCPGGAGL